MHTQPASTRLRMRIPLLFAFLSFSLISTGNSQDLDNFASTRWPRIPTPPPMDPEYQYGRNMALTGKIDGHAAAIKSIAVGDSTFLITTNDASEGYRFYKMNQTGNAEYFGKVRIDNGFYTRDVDAIAYGDTVRLLMAVSTVFDKVYPTSRIISFALTGANLIKIMDSSHYSMMNNIQLEIIPGLGNIEQIIQFDGRLFISSNTNKLYSYDVSHQSLLVKDSITLNPSLPTKHQGSEKIHEVKGYKNTTTGERTIGLGLVRSGMCLLTYNSNWQLTDTKYQLYDFDRTLFPEIVLNPNKWVYDTTFTATPSDERNHKWDHRVCHSVIPYDHDGVKYVLTSDEFTSYVGLQDSFGNWQNGIWELLDFYQPNAVTHDTTTFYFNGKPFFNHWYAKSIDENASHRLNYINRNHPRFPGTDPNKFQGAFVRIWNRDSLGRNDLTINNGGLLMNAYDVGEDPANPIGYIGLNNIPDTSLVPTGIHEPILMGNRLYLAGYNTGARVLELNGSNLKLKGYIRTETFLSNDPSSPNFYARPEGGMYSRGAYRLIPDALRNQVLFSSDINHGTWIYRFFDSTVCDTIRHDSFQSHVEIGSITCSTRTNFTIQCDAIVASGSTVKLVECTTFKFDPSKKLYVNGELHVRGVDFDTSNVHALSHIVVHNGGKVYLGQQDQPINGFHTMDIDSGGIAYINSGSTINFMRGGVINVYGELQINSTTLNDQSRIVCKAGGVVKVQSNAIVNGIKHIIVEQGGALEINDGNVVKVAPRGVIKIHGGLNANLTGNKWARFERAVGNLSWGGIIIDSLSTTTQSAVIFRHVTIKGAYQAGISTNICQGCSQPIIDSCQITDNQIGLLVYSDSPFITHNQINNNTYGLVGYYMSTAVEYNQFKKNSSFGAQLHNCGNLWRGNRCDSNGIGLYAFESVTIPFNRWSQNFECDDWGGNGFRRNYTGFWVGDLSNPTFECHNSVHLNYTWDFSLNDGTGFIGWDNYPDSTLLSWYFGKNLAPVQWNPMCNCPLDPVLLKSQLAKNSHPGTPIASDPQYKHAMRKAMMHRMKNKLSDAIVEYKEAMKFIKYREEAEQCFINWRQVLLDAKFNKKSNAAEEADTNLIAQGLIQTLQSLRNNADSSWMRHTATEALAGVYMVQRQCEEALPLYDELVSLQKSEPILARRALTSLVILHHRGLGDYETALKVHDQIELLYPKSRALIFAKIDLGLPLTEEETALLQKGEPHESDSSASKGMNTTEQRGYQLHQCFPNPFNPLTTIRYSLPATSRVVLSIFDPLGKEVRTLVNEEQPAGEYSVVFEGNGLPSGTYTYRLSATNIESGDNLSLQRTMVLVK